MKNLENHLKQFSYFSQKLEQAVELKHAVAIRQYDTLLAELMPNNGYQERAFSPYQYMNIYGLTLIEDLLKQEYEISDKHTLVYL